MKAKLIQRKLSGWAGIAAIAMGLFGINGNSLAADPLVDAIVGTAGGAIIGGIADGSSGARTGAWVGGGLGLAHGLYRVHWSDRPRYGYYHGYDDYWHTDYRHNRWRSDRRYREALRRQEIEREQTVRRLTEAKIELERTRAELQRTQAQLEMHRQTIHAKPVGNHGYQAGNTFSEAAIIFEIQKTLAQLRYPVGPATGMLDPATIEAIKQFQEANDLDATGAPSQPLLEFMKQRRN